MQTDATSEDSSDTENSDSEDEESEYAMNNENKNEIIIIVPYSYERWLCTH